jgi:hypothetical protein
VSIRWGKAGSFEIEYKGFDGGINVQEPETEIPDNCTPSANNFQVRNKELRSRPAFMQQFAGMDNVNPALGEFSFLDVNSVQHTVGWNTRGLWQLAPEGQPPGALGPWSILGGPNLAPDIPVSYQAFAEILYYTNGNPWVATWDGIATIPTSTQTFSAPLFVGGDGTVASSAFGISKATAPTVFGAGVTGPVALGALFIGELNNQILLANVTALDQNGVNSTTSGTPLTFPQRLWWSANGIPNLFDPTFNTSSGFNDFLDVPDVITGMVTVGVYGYLFRTNGITFFEPTGNAVTPFQFDHLWASNHGIGNVYPWSIHSYGSIACFISLEQIYQMGVSSFEPIGGKARDAIMADLAFASDNPVASIVPTERLGYVYLTYRISIPLKTFTRHYWYSIEDKNWMAFDTPNLLQTGRCEEVWTGVLANLPIGAQPAGSGAKGGGGSGGGGIVIGCFSGNVRVKTKKGYIRLDELPTRDSFRIVNETGEHVAVAIVHDKYLGTMIDMGESELVTMEHLFKYIDGWRTAEKHFPHNPRLEEWQGKVYNIHVLSSLQEDMHYVLENGEIAHNKQGHQT